jgi:sec-independent protein translocase protein TatA
LAQPVSHLHYMKESNMGFPMGLEWLIILVIIVLLFGPGRIGKTLGELGSGLRSFKDGLSSDKKDDDDQSKPPADEKK